MKTLVQLGLLLPFAGLMLSGSGGAATWPGTTTRVSVSSGGVQGSGDSLSPAISSDHGRYVAFQSFAANLVSEDTNGWADVFVRDRQARTTERVSLSSAEEQANGESWSPAISSDGRYVAFQSFAGNLVSGDTNNFCQIDPDPELENCEDVFVRDRQAGTTTRVSLDSAGIQGNGGSGGWLSISAGGRYVAFTSDASNLVAGDTNGTGDVFVRDRDTDGDGIFDEAEAVSTTRVSVDSGGTQANGESYYAAISADGRFVAFGSAASNLVTGDTNGYPDVFVRDRQAGTTTRVSLDSAGIQGNGGSFAPAISSDGHYVAFKSDATNLVPGDSNGVEDVFLRDRQAGSTERVSVDTAGNQGNGESSDPAISADGRYVAFPSEASNLVLGDTNGYQDVFVRDRQAGTTARVSVASGGEQAVDGASLAPGVSSDGRHVVFQSGASTLVPDDTNSRQDIFVRGSLGTVGGIAELPDVSEPSGHDYTLLAGLAAVVLALLTAGAWYAGDRFGQG